MSDTVPTQYRAVPLIAGPDGNPPPLELVDEVPFATCPNCGTVDRSVMFLDLWPCAICSCAPAE